MCSGAARPETYLYSIHKPRERLLEVPQDRAERGRRMDLVRTALG